MSYPCRRFCLQFPTFAAAPTKQLLTAQDFTYKSFRNGNLGGDLSIRMKTRILRGGGPIP
jgi:hypothetical protein